MGLQFPKNLIKATTASFPTYFLQSTTFLPIRRTSSPVSIRAYFVPLLQRCFRSDSSEWWNHAMKLATQNLQASLNNNNSIQPPLLDKFKKYDHQTSLEFTKSNQPTPNFFNSIPQDSLRYLCHLQIRNIPFLSRDIACLINAAPFLQSIDIKSSPELIHFQNFRSDLASKFTAGERRISLTRLKLINVSIAPKDILAFLEFCPRLKEIELSGVSLKPNDLKNANFSKIPYHSRVNLEELYLFNEDILKEDISHMLVNFPSLKRVGLSGCRFISKNHLHVLKRYFPKVLFL